MLAGCDRAARLVDQMRTLARLDPQRTFAGGARFELAGAARDAVAAIAPAGLARGVEVGLEAAPAQVVGDPALVAILLRNLLDNAIRHSPDGVSVDVRVRAAEVGGELVVADRGPGVPPEERERLGEPASGRGLEVRVRFAHR